MTNGDAPQGGSHLKFGVDDLKWVSVKLIHLLNIDPNLGPMNHLNQIDQLATQTWVKLQHRWKFDTDDQSWSIGRNEAQVANIGEGERWNGETV